MSDIHADHQGMWVCVVPVLTTNHLPQNVCNAVANEIRTRNRAGADYEEGMWVHVPSSEGDDTEAPSELKGIFAWCRKHGFSYVRLDRDGDTIRGLPTWDW